MLKINPKFNPELDPEFVPAVLWNRAYQAATEANAQSTPFAICMQRNNGAVSRFDTKVLPHTPENQADNVKYIERLVKYMLWMYGGSTIFLGGDVALANEVAAKYTPKGERAFDFDFFSGVYQKPLTVKIVSFEQAPQKSEITVRLGGNKDGVRIGFDLGGSDRKYALMVDGTVIDSGETKWDPYFNTDCKYHVEGLEDTIRQAMQKIPAGRHLEAIGGSSAGVIVDNQIPVASLFRGVKKANNDQMPADALNIFVNLGKKFNVPCITINDGEVTALLGAQEQQSPSVLGISMGTSVAGGYVNPNGNITDWLNELAFVPCDYRANGPKDEWSGDEGCCVQYFCQQGVSRLAKQNGWIFPAEMKDPEILESIQAEMAAGSEKAKKLYETIGIMFGYTIAHFADFYPEIKKLLILGRVTSGNGGNLILDTAKCVLDQEFPELSAKISFCIPDEKNKRHGQAAAAATLPEIAH